MAALACGATHATTPGSSGGGGSGDAGSGGKMGGDEIGGFVGSAGRSAGASGDGGAAGLGGARQCRPSGPPASDSNAKQTPVEAIRSLAIEAPAPADACEHPPPSGAGGVAPLGSDACGCSGLSCAASQVCVNAVVELGAACGQPQRANQCFATCASDADCGDDQICLPAFAANEFARCFKAGCRTGSECCSGRCLVSTGYRSQCNPNVVLQIECQ